IKTGDKHFVTVDSHNLKNEAITAIQKLPKESYNEYRAYEYPKKQNDTISELINDSDKWASQNATNGISLKLVGDKKIYMTHFEQDVIEKVLSKNLQITLKSCDKQKITNLPIFINWFIKSFVNLYDSKDLIIGVATDKKEDLKKLLEKIEEIQKLNGYEDIFSILDVSYINNENDRKKVSTTSTIRHPYIPKIHLCFPLTFEGIIERLKKDINIKVFVVGANVAMWKVKDMNRIKKCN
ncbi:hypothetical protein CU098_005607, partial [Rhizopus stolonifer]